MTRSKQQRRLARLEKKLAGIHATIDASKLIRRIGHMVVAAADERRKRLGLVWGTEFARRTRKYCGRVSP